MAWVPTTILTLPSAMAASASSPRLALLLARQPADLDAERLQPPGEVDGVLLGQQLGRRHQPHLTAVADSRSAASAATSVFAGAHIPCTSRIAGVALLRRSLLISATHPVLGTGGAERQSAEQLRHQGGAGLRARASWVCAWARTFSTERVGQQLLQHQPLLGRVLAASQQGQRHRGAGGAAVPQGGGQIDLLGIEAGGQQLFDAGREIELGQGLIREAAQG